MSSSPEQTSDDKTKESAADPIEHTTEEAKAKGSMVDAPKSEAEQRPDVSEIISLKEQLRQSNANVEALRTHVLLLGEELIETSMDSVGFSAGQTAAAVVGTGIGLHFLLKGQAPEALCASGVILMMWGTQFLTEGAMMEYHRNSFRRTTPRLQEARSPWVPMALGAVGIAAGCCYLSGLFTPSK